MDAESLEVIKAYTTHTPLNSASLLPGKPYVSILWTLLETADLSYHQVLLGGGQDAMNVTTTGARQGQFEVRFYHR